MVEPDLNSEGKLLDCLYENVFKVVHNIETRLCMMISNFVVVFSERSISCGFMLL